MKITWRMWVMIFFVIASLIAIFSIPPLFLEKGVVVKAVQQNSSLFEKGLRPGEIIKQINGQEILTSADYNKAMEPYALLVGNQTQKFNIVTDKNEIIGLFSQDVTKQVAIEQIPPTRLKTGLDIQGGARALVTAENLTLNDEQLDDLISVSQERLNVYGLTDMKLKKVSDLSGNKYMLVEIAGSSPQDLEELIAKQGKFEAKIGNKTVFSGGNEDVTYVGRSGKDAGIYDCQTTEKGEFCEFRFVIYLSDKAAQRHANITSEVPLNLSSGGRYLEKTIDFYIDGVLTSSLNIGADLKGNPTTSVQISGSGSGPDRKTAIEDTQREMKKLQTILITGSLPFKLQIVKIDKISAFLGDDFTKTILITGIFSALGVTVIIFLRYRAIKISIAIMLMVASEILIILGFSALMKANIDLASIAGIIATIGTGVDDQIVIVDESRRGSSEESTKQKIKNALFIVFSAYATAVASLFPLYYAGAGLLKGFAFTTLVGITAGVFITRPAFADMINQWAEK